MKIGHVSPFFYPVIGGWEEAIRNKSVECIRQGHEVSVLTCNEGHDRRRIEKSEESVEGIRVKRFPVWFHVSNFYRVWPGFLKHLEGFEVLHLHNFRHFHVDAALARKRKQKTVLRAGSPFHPKSLGLGLARQAYDVLLAKRVFAQVDALLAYHETEKKRFVALGCPEEKIRVVPFGVDAWFLGKGDGEKFRDENGLREKIVLNVGRLHYYKQPETLIRAAAELKDRETSVVFIGGGETNYVQGLRKLAKRLGVQEQVRFLPGTHDKELLRNAYAACNAFVLPSVYEPFGIVLLEAMAQGKPVVSTPYDGPMHLLAGGCGTFFEPGDHQTLARKLDAFLGDAGLARKTGNHGREKAKDYTWDLVAKKVMQVYGEVLG
ncbi:MAG: glycosyltransferase family 4 protein [Candidatus Diapherotrites archaeon]|uniref:Glycosyltransferase family 4 protein n=1 Tax=Candidatus Iainarchaeum sp. TaxID=3101447 RepID=A0A8T4L804_9ARCH|nr:glycosyltransferase family 4 protein [Candidatus Diapherotrites archaeon]